MKVSGIILQNILRRHEEGRERSPRSLAEFRLPYRSFCLSAVLPYYAADRPKVHDAIREMHRVLAYVRGSEEVSGALELRGGEGVIVAQAVPERSAQRGVLSLHGPARTRLCSGGSKDSQQIQKGR